MNKIKISFMLIIIIFIINVLSPAFIFADTLPAFYQINYKDGYNYVVLQLNNSFNNNYQFDNFTDDVIRNFNINDFIVLEIPNTARVRMLRDYPSDTVEYYYNYLVVESNYIYVYNLIDFSYFGTYSNIFCGINYNAEYEDEAFYAPFSIAGSTLGIGQYSNAFQTRNSINLNYPANIVPSDYNLPDDNNNTPVAPTAAPSGVPEGYIQKISFYAHIPEGVSNGLFINNRYYDLYIFPDVENNTRDMAYSIMPYYLENGTPDFQMSGSKRLFYSKYSSNLYYSSYDTYSIEYNIPFIYSFNNNNILSFSSNNFKDRYLSSNINGLDRNIGSTCGFILDNYSYASSYNNNAYNYKVLIVQHTENASDDGFICFDGYKTELSSFSSKSHIEQFKISKPIFYDYNFFKTYPCYDYVDDRIDIVNKFTTFTVYGYEYNSVIFDTDTPVSSPTPLPPTATPVLKVTLSPTPTIFIINPTGPLPSPSVVFIGNETDYRPFWVELTEGILSIPQKIISGIVSLFIPNEQDLYKINDVANNTLNSVGLDLGKVSLLQIAKYSDEVEYENENFFDELLTDILPPDTYNIKFTVDSDGIPLQFIDWNALKIFRKYFGGIVRIIFWFATGFYFIHVIKKHFSFIDVNNPYIGNNGSVGFDADKGKLIDF